MSKFKILSMYDEVQVIDKQYHFLRKILTNSLSAPTLTFKEITKVDIQEIYIIYKGEKILYVGKTTRTGKVRMRELAADFGSHILTGSFYRSVLRIWGLCFNLENALKQEWVRDEKITLEEFVKHQQSVMSIS